MNKKWMKTLHQNIFFRHYIWYIYIYIVFISISNIYTHPLMRDVCVSKDVGPTWFIKSCSFYKPVAGKSNHFHKCVELPQQCMIPTAMCLWKTLKDLEIHIVEPYFENFMCVIRFLLSFSSPWLQVPRCSPVLSGSATALNTTIFHKPCHWIIPCCQTSSWAPTASCAWSVAGTLRANSPGFGSSTGWKIATAIGPWPAWRALLGRSTTFSEAFDFDIFWLAWNTMMRIDSVENFGWFGRSILIAHGDEREELNCLMGKPSHSISRDSASEWVSWTQPFLEFFLGITWKIRPCTSHDGQLQVAIICHHGPCTERAWQHCLVTWFPPYYPILPFAARPNSLFLEMGSDGSKNVNEQLKGYHLIF